jgi:predicted dehydrogenase
MVGGGEGAFIGGVHRIAAMLDNEVELVAGAFSRDAENSKRTGTRLYLDPNRVYGSYQEMAEQEAKLPEGDRIDFVSIVTPNSSHYDIARTFLSAGFHVVLDKPMTFDLDQAKSLKKQVDETGLVFALTHNYTGNAVVREARQLFATGKMGPVRKVVAEYLQDFLAYPHEKEGMKQAAWRVDPAQAGAGGTLGDVGSHTFNLTEYITGDKVVALCADTSTFLPDRTLDEDANILVRFAGGGKGVITVSQIAIGEENALRIKAFGSKGAVNWDQENPNYLGVAYFGEPRQTFTRASGYLSEEASRVGRIPGGHPEGYLEAFANVYVDAIEAIRAHIDGKPMDPTDYRFPTVYDGLRGMEFIVKAVESAKKGGVWVDMET